MNTMSDQDVCAVIKTNLKTLLKMQNITQKTLAEQVGVSPSTMNDYCSGKRVPQATLLVQLRKLYGIDLNDFLTSTISAPVSTRQTDPSPNEGIRDDYAKYCGPYLVYFMDTSKYKGRDTLTPSLSLLYGILYIYEDPSSIANIQYKCAAVLGIENKEDAAALLEEFRSATTVDILGKIDTSYGAKSYYGDFELSAEHIFINLRHPGTDRAFAILHKVNNNKKYYAGGIGAINSISKGREHMPVMQFFGMTRHPLALSPEEIQHALLLKYPIIDVKEGTEEVLHAIRKLFLDDDDARSAFSFDQKRIFLTSIIERIVRVNIERNAFRYAKVSTEDDDIWYHIAKPVPKA